MKYSYDLGQKQFDALLAIFSQDREEAGQKYEHIRHGLIRYFDVKGCNDPQGLADETINRGAVKLSCLLAQDKLVVILKRKAADGCLRLLLDL